MARSMRARYMEWAKTESQAPFNLATSGIVNVPISEFPLRLEDLEVTTSASGYGYPPLRARLAAHTGAPENCIVAATGTSMANHLAMAAVLHPGDEVLLELPAYGPLLDVASFLGARINRIPRQFGTGFALDAAEIEAVMTADTRLIVLSNLHNPSGALLSAETLREIAELALRGGARVLVDEVYLEMLFDPDAPHSFHLGQTMAGAENPFIVTSSLTKLYGLSGLRCGWVLAAPDLARRIWLLNDLFGSVAAHSAERMSVLAFDHLEQFRERGRSLLVANRELLDAFLDSRDDLECFRPPAGTVVFPRLVRGEAENFLKLLREKYETSVVPGRFFEMPQHFRIGIGDETASLRVCLERLGSALDEFRGKA
ncbi:MAG: pyridoxal phosphate-dependent aminotransferase [Verrucomicrobiota bacterium]|nr:pyridoxal phosphate-dependent aminotransferase [Verrucomicrobiota bacterium]